MHEVKKMTKRFEFNDSDLEIENNEVKIDDIETDRIIKIGRAHV